MTTQKLFLLTPGFEADGEKQFCPDCMLLEGVLAVFGQETAGLEVVRVPFAKPRKLLVDLVGEEHQSCPALVREVNGRLVAIDDPKQILAVLHEDFGIPTARGMA
ncbi:DUF3088 family protein [Ensifer sp. YR511]|uniref:DUF3088 family protein n=1 Tax=Ensifer sp. YR511 TaxID=1855294 RepID=UPI0008802CBF|nr:DUF3088 family protein [Ensifer sp. YR511]SDN42548.1 Protein of unknown function [Ensifer sp. YR511]